MKAAFGLILVTFGLVGIDRATKIAMMARSSQGGPFPFPHILELTHHQNFGVIANIPIPMPFILLLTAIAMTLIAFGFIRATRRREMREAVALSIVLAGAIGNFWDRVQWQYVFDWILLFGRSAINLADVMIGAGLLWYLVDRSHDLKHEGPKAARGNEEMRG